jgi:glycosyltransferase involved in cell wall biosynthesis
VVVTLHSTADPIHASHKKLKNIASALKGCSRVLVHSIKDLNKLKDLGLSDNLTLIPHGVLDYRPIAKNHKTKNINQPFVVASYGFFLPHKGLLELIDAISLMKNQGFDVRLKMVNSEYPAIESRDIIFAAKNKIKYNCISDIVELHTSYLEDDESLSLLSSADLIIFPYQETGESASGAVRYGIATGLPVAVTPLAIFDDVSAAVHKLPGTTASDIAQGIQDIAAQIHSQSELFDAVDQASRQWRAEHSYTRIGRRIGNMLYSLWLNKQINSRN